MQKEQLQTILDLQSTHSIKDNLLITIYLSFKTPKGIFAKDLIETLLINDEDLSFYLKLLNENELLSDKELKYLKRKTTALTSTNKSSNMKADCEKVIFHLNQLLGTSSKLTSQKEKYILKQFKAGYTVEQCIGVITYFYHQWKDDVRFNKYIRIETLLNGKFEERLEEASKAISNLQKQDLEIKQVCKIFAENYQKNIFNQEINGDDAYLYVDLETKSAIAMWINKGVSVQDMCGVIAEYISCWASNPELVHKISLSKIVDNKFPERLEFYNKRKIMMESNVLPQISQKQLLRRESENNINSWAENYSRSYHAACSIK